VNTENFGFLGAIEASQSFARRITKQAANTCSLTPWPEQQQQAVDVTERSCVGGRAIEHEKHDSDCEGIRICEIACILQRRAVCDSSGQKIFLIIIS
jgi:hypothetical protein